MKDLPAEYKAEVMALADKYASEFVELRRQIHMHPELSFQEYATSELVAERLQKWGYHVDRTLGGTGVVGTLRHGTGSKSIGLRADMDALPIEEMTNLAYASVNKGVMHACGHDGHTAMLLAAAKIISERRSFSGSVHLIFQPAEEFGPPESGATRMINDGLFEKYPCNAIFGMHNKPGHSQGDLIFGSGPMMAAADKVIIVINGNGGHGARPHETRDPIIAAASIIMNLQTIVSRNVDPLKTSVITVGVVQAGTSCVIVPQTARLELTVRTLDSEVRELVKSRIIHLVESQSVSLGVTADIDYQKGYALLNNSYEETQFARDVGISLIGNDNVIKNGTPSTGSEDFAYMLEKCPGSFFFIGNDGPETKQSLHNPGFDFNDNNISPGAAYWTVLVESYLHDED